MKVELPEKCTACFTELAGKDIVAWICSDGAANVFCETCNPTPSLVRKEGDRRAELVRLTAAALPVSFGQSPPGRWSSEQLGLMLKMAVAMAEGCIEAIDAAMEEADG